MVMKFEQKKDCAIIYNFCIYYNHIKHHLHHENNYTSKIAHAAQIVVVQKTDRNFIEA